MANITEKTMVKVINNTKGSLSFKGIDDRKYMFLNPASPRLIPFNIVRGLYDEYPTFITDGYIVFDASVYIALGVDEDIYKKIITLSEIEELLTKDEDVIKDTLEGASKVIKENVAMVAKEKKLDSRRKSKVIKEATGLDIEDQEFDD